MLTRQVEQGWLLLQVLSGPLGPVLINNHTLNDLNSIIIDKMQHGVATYMPL